MRAALIGSGGPVLGREFTLDEPIVTIGRRDENTVVIKDPTVSRKHAEIRRDGDDYLIVDKNSTSGVMVNGQAISGERRLQDGDRIGIGTSAVFLVQLPPTESKTMSFPQAQLGDQGRTQFITRTDLDDPRAIPATPPPAASPPAPRPSEMPSGFGQDSRPMRQAEPAAPPLFAPPPASTSGSRPGDFSPPLAPPPPAPERGSASGWSGGSQAGSSSEVPAPQFAPPQFGTPASPPPPTFSAAPEVPRFGGNVPPPASFAPPPTNTAGSNFGSPSGSPAFSPPPAAPSFAPPPPAGNSSPSVGLPSSAMAPQRSSRRGLVIGLTVLVLLLIIAAVVVFLLVSGSLGGS
ncbi:MAG TPA: FHA domain-containing protein [Thermomicrobiales bacterium]